MKNCLFFILSIALASCGEKKDNNSSGKKEETKESRLARIDSMEKKLHSLQPGMMDNATAGTTVNAYSDFANRYSEDKHSPEFMYRAADLSNGMGRYQEAINFWKGIIDRYPQYNKLPECYFLEGFTYQDKLKDFAQAKACYDKLIELYPNHHYSSDAKALMQYFGKTDEEIIKEFKKKEKNQ